MLKNFNNSRIFLPQRCQLGYESRTYEPDLLAMVQAIHEDPKGKSVDRRYGFGLLVGSDRVVCLGLQRITLLEFCIREE
jgi:hypothetical protein